MLIAFQDEMVRAAAEAGAAGRLGGSAALDLAAALSVLACAPTLADVLTLRSLLLQPLGKGQTSRYFLGTAAIGVTFQLVDEGGQPIQTSHTRENLVSVIAVAVEAVGPTREEAMFSW